MRFRSVLREPLVHFVVLGGLLFAWFAWSGGGSGPGSTRIEVTPGLVKHLVLGYARTWQRPPTDAELKGLIDEHVKEEIAVREATAMGLDRDDTIIRRRLRQKFEFLVEDPATRAAPTDAELQEWLDRHPEASSTEPQVALRQVFVSTERRGAAASSEAGRLLATLRAGGPGAEIGAMGDASLLPGELPLGPLSEVARTFGSDFAERIEAIEPGRWTGPVESSYGLHLILVTERRAPSKATLAEVRPLVEREFEAERRRARLEAHYRTLLENYTVVIDLPEEPAR